MVSVCSNASDQARKDSQSDAWVANPPWANFELFISQLVLQYSGAGDQQAASDRLTILSQLPILELTPESLELARALVNEKALPKKAELDAFHISLATVHGMDYLLTWNCKHIANAEMQPAISQRPACPEVTIGRSFARRKN